ncbi:MAG TPA: hypothetical protein VD927_05090 [Chryseosolibacter sp.]|nr:hypothetical protein [Chryseosolibacter sp.]
MKHNDHRKFSKPSTRAAGDEMNEEVCNTADENFSERLHTTFGYKALPE